MSVDRLDRTRVDTTPYQNATRLIGSHLAREKYRKSEFYSLSTCQTKLISKSTNVEVEDLKNLLETFIEKRNL